MDQTRCPACDVELDMGANGPCPQCNSTARSRFVVFDDMVQARDGFDRLEARHGEPGLVKPFREVTERVKHNHDRDRDERRLLVFDRDENYYLQEWTDLDTGDVTYRKEGALDDPAMHGESARRARKRSS